MTAWPQITIQHLLLTVISTLTIIHLLLCITSGSAHISPEMVKRRSSIGRHSHVAKRLKTLRNNQPEATSVQSQPIPQYPEAYSYQDASFINQTDIGPMDFTCEHCGAKKFRQESSEICCGSGKISLPLYPEPPQYPSGHCTYNVRTLYVQCPLGCIVLAHIQSSRFKTFPRQY